MKKAKSLKVYLIVGRNNPKLYSTKRFKEEAKAMGIKFRVLEVYKFDLVIGDNGKEVIYYNEKPLPLPDVVIPRYNTSNYAHMVTKFYEDSPVFVVNDSRARQIAKDKLSSLQLLNAQNIPVPNSILAKTPLKLDFVEKHLDYPIIVKKGEGSVGKGIMLTNNRAELEDLIEILEASVDYQKHNFILQEFISTKRGQDIRVIVVGGTPIGAMLRSGKEGDYKANYSGGGTVKPIELTPEIEWLAIESAKIIGLEVAGVDLLFDKDGYRVCEVNASAGFEGFEKATNINVPQEIFKYLQVRVRPTNVEDSPLEA
ncbi:MAG: RimK family alpha-L-glutamate ligase [Candidatus Doudnabacteria bacterium]